jgi:hypothetical protein
MNTETPVVTIDTPPAIDTSTPPAIVTILPQQVAAELIEAGAAIASGHKTVGSSERRYAAMLSKAMPGWHKLAHDDDSNESKALKAGPKAKLFEQLKAAGHSNPGTIWGRLRKYAAEDEATAAGTEGEGEGTEGDTGTEGNNKREIRARIREELAKLIKAIDKDQFPPEDLRAVKTYLELAIIKATPAAPTEQAEQAEQAA